MGLSFTSHLMNAFQEEGGETLRARLTRFSRRNEHCYSRDNLPPDEYDLSTIEKGFPQLVILQRVGRLEHQGLVDTHS